MALSGGFNVWGREKGLLAKSFYYVSMATKNRIATTLRESCFLQVLLEDMDLGID